MNNDSSEGSETLDREYMYELWKQEVLNRYHPRCVFSSLKLLKDVCNAENWSVSYGNCRNKTHLFCRMNVNISFFTPTHISAGVQNVLNVYSISPGTSILLFLFLNIQHAVLSCNEIIFFCQVFLKHNIYILSFYLITTVLGSKHRKNKHRETCKLVSVWHANTNKYKSKV